MKELGKVSFNLDMRASAMRPVGHNQRGGVLTLVVHHVLDELGIPCQYLLDGPGRFVIQSFCQSRSGPVLVIQEDDRHFMRLRMH